MAQSHGYLSSIGIDPVTAVASSLTPSEEKDVQGTNGSSAPSRAKKTGATKAWESPALEKYHWFERCSNAFHVFGKFAWFGFRCQGSRKWRVHDRSGLFFSPSLWMPSLCRHQKIGSSKGLRAPEFLFWSGSARHLCEVLRGKSA